MIAGSRLPVLRTLAVLVALAVASSPADAAEQAPDTMLSAAEVQRYFAPYAAGVRECYLQQARSKTADGTLRLELIIRPEGTVFRFGFAAPGVTPPWLARLDACLRKLVPTWHFPTRARFTTAVLPFLFQRTRAPGAGPVESCWDPRGCPPGATGGDR